MTTLPSCRRRAARLAPGLLLLALAACGGGDGPPTQSNPVTQVSVTGPTALVAGGAPAQLTATPRNASGAAVSGQTVAWSSTAEGVATVSGTGLVTPLAPGTATIRASVGTVTGTLDVTVAPAPVATVAVAPDAFQLQPAETRQLAATARDAGGNVLVGRAVAWQSLDPSVATVSAGGEVRAAAPGQARIVGTVEGKADTATVTVYAPVAARVMVSPRFAVANVGASTTLSAEAFMADGTKILAPSFTWTSLHAALSVTPSGVATGLLQPGAYRVFAQMSQAADTATVAVLGPTSLLSTAFPGISILGEALRGQTFTVPLVLDMSRVGTSGDLGALQLEVRFDPAVLVYDGYGAAARGSLDVFSPAPGTVRVAFAETSPQGSANVVVAALTFRVRDDAAAGARSALALTYTAAPTSTSFVPYEMPVAVGGSLRVVVP